ncbi:MAG: glycosyltransferase family 2 protein [Actinomycetota bacterium]|nr:glycosyltransferase family 2 protein [Actinomycetota bacterium]
MAAGLYAYVGYPLLVGLASRIAGRRGPPAPSGQSPPTLSVIVCAYDERDFIADKVADIGAQDYPPERLEIIVVADGSRDDTAAVARRLGARVLWRPERAGKAAAVNRGAAAARGDILCLTDANCRLAPGSLRALVAPFADPRVAVVSGAKTVQGPGARGTGEGLYWRVEAYLKRCESALGCTMGAPGEICGVRRRTFRPLPVSTVCDDYHMVCDALARGLRVAYAADAVATETVSATVAGEFERRTRIGAGTWQATLAHLRLLDPRGGWTAVAFLSHRVLRSLVVPPLLPALWLSSLRRARHGGLPRLLAALQAGAYAAAGAGALSDARVFAVPFQFALTNIATARGALRYVLGKQPSAWHTVSRAAPGHGQGRRWPSESATSSTASAPAEPSTSSWTWPGRQPPGWT